MKKEEFDKIIKNNLIKSGINSFGYETEDKKIYECYYDDVSFEHFKGEMKRKHYKAYSEGGGGELKAKKGRYGFLPPKMASVASSSHFCYLALRNGYDGSDEVEFEHECKIKGITSPTSPQLDAFVPERQVYFEVKCHEIFDSHQIIMKEKYLSLLCAEGNDFGIDTTFDVQNGQFRVPLELFDIEKTSSMFDVKQFLCHLMGIASSKDNTKTATLAYLFFKPKTNDDNEKREIEELFDALKSEIEKLFCSTPIQNFIKKNNIVLRAIAQNSYVMEELTSQNTKVLWE